MRFRTTTAADSGHAEFTVIVREPVPDTATVRSILDWLRDAVLGGQWIEPRQVFSIAGRMVRVIAREDGTLGLEEEVTPGVWSEQVDEIITDLRHQETVCARLELAMFDGSVAGTDMVALRPCVRTTGTLGFRRHGGTPDQGMSGWFLVCLDEHDHEPVGYSSLRHVLAEWPYLRQFLALPPDTTVVLEPSVILAGSVLATVVRDGVDITHGGIWFGPQRAPLSMARARRGLGSFGDGLTRTMIGEQLGLPDVVARVALTSTEESGAWWVAWALDDIQDAIADGTRFTAGQTVRSGWRTLRLVERPDGLLGLEERVTGDHWVEQVDQTLRESWTQRQVTSGLGLEAGIDFPADTQLAAVADCVDETVSALMLSRDSLDDSMHSGWTVTCARSHDHGVLRTRTLWDLAESLPFVTAFLALPAPISVRIDTARDTDPTAIRARVLLWDRELLPEPGSYTAELLGTEDLLGA
ncbi:hypothetical protein [Nocardia sp. NPDC056100]|uniref:immunity protein Imm33 domain-containing protein n=1 Tax=Nocardia sp. NPDC056100 TaxID=3345712 RepID=UPI0035E01374